MSTTQNDWFDNHKAAIRAMSPEDRAKWDAGAAMVLASLNPSKSYIGREPIRRPHASRVVKVQETETTRRGAAMVLAALAQQTLPGYIVPRPSAQN